MHLLKPRPSIFFASLFPIFLLFFFFDSSIASATVTDRNDTALKNNTTNHNQTQQASSQVSQSPLSTDQHSIAKNNTDSSLVPVNHSITKTISVTATVLPMLTVIKEHTDHQSAPIIKAYSNHPKPLQKTVTLINQKEAFLFHLAI